MKKIHIFLFIFCSVLLVSCSNNTEIINQNNNANENDYVFSESIILENNNDEDLELLNSDSNLEQPNNENDVAKENTDIVEQNNSVVDNMEIEEANEQLKNEEDILFEKVNSESEIENIENNTVDILEEDSTNTSDVKEYRLITVDELLEFVDLSREDLLYVDIEALIEDGKCTTQLFEIATAEDVRNQLLNENEQGKAKYEFWKNNFEYLLFNPTIERADNFNLTDCKKIVVYYYFENSGKAFLLDLDTNRGYYGSSNKNPLYNINNAEITVDLTYDILADVIIRIEDAKLEELDYSYISQEDIGARNSWGIAFECEEGIVRYYVYNATGEEPSRIINCVHDLLEYAKGLAE
ncbi:MAG: hypothetical protein J6D42_01320 [Clostridia bacterium]|nr:hypothetical protein [Clostridia bacterium]